MTLEVKGLRKSYGNKLAIDDISFTIPEGQVFGLLGLNGAGKSTTIRIILDILTADKGEVLWNGTPARKHPKSTFGYLPEERGLYPNMRVLDELILFGRLQGLSKQDASASANEWIERFEIPHYAKNTVVELSKGNQQKIQFIAAVIHNPKVIILDEPFSGLDPVNTSLFKSVFLDLVKTGATILFSSHQLAHVEELSDAVGIIHQSKMMVQGNLNDLISAQSPQTIRIRADEAAVRSKLTPNTKELLQSDKRTGTLTLPASAVNPNDLLRQLVDAQIDVAQFELVRPTLNDIFLEKVGKSE
ncbi:ABC transporter ATP-binding protein [Alicyclobacillus sp. SO9]|uniref:ABC transporter ATP-binding protein n=1 Tax=Alicyclobacillus sp. SO9 TaxID=2665646 RepID=UPI0018E7AD44|nr:ATP-binding cassette domain-containing protein [Alicyclobacillus sp. SO9]